MIYCVEDDQGIRELMLYTLKASGFEAAGFSSGHELEEGLTDALPELILLDIMLPGDDGITILKKLKTAANTRDIPVIMASAKGTEYDKVVGLDLGADDYLVKPFGMMEMVSRVRAVLRRNKTVTAKQESVLQNGAVKMDDATHIVEVAGRQVELTLKEYDLLRLFLKDTGRVFNREHLLDQVWGIDFAGESRTVDVHVGTLRSKLGECGSYIKTIRGVGYRMEKQA